MALADQYARYLQHFGNTVPVCEMVDESQVSDLVALRHDVDYDLWVALELAFWEHRLSRRATYYILHTAQYWHDPHLLDACLQIQDFGHEVGLHTNLLVQWYRGEIDDIAVELDRLVSFLRNGGIRLRGIAAHGDALCYDIGFTNYWLFEELRPDNPRTQESRMTAEGIRAGSDQRCIDFKEACLVRPDGAKLDYWSLRLQDFGLDYEASRVQWDHYYSDSGGYWKRTPDPLDVDLDRGRHCILMHPIHWRGPQRHYYFLSTARSGSKWLAKFLNAATSTTCRHEFSLNHRFIKSELKLDKRTGTGFRQLLANRDEAASMIHEARAWSETLLSDYAEVNVYLEQFLDQMPKDEDTIFVHLYRDPKAVVRSLWQRGWYAVPHDDRHPPVPVEHWDLMSQFEQICWYVRDVNQRLAAYCSHSLRLEAAVRSFSDFTNQLIDLGIAVYPRFAARVSVLPEDRTQHWDVSPYDAWSPENKELFDEICGPIAAQLGYTAQTDPRGPKVEATRVRREPPQVTLLAETSCLCRAGAIAVRNATLACEHHNKVGVTFAPDLNAHALLGGGYFHGKKGVWDRDVSQLGATGQEFPSYGGWWTSPDQIHTVELSIQIAASAHVRLLCLSYDSQGTLIDKRDIGILRGPEDRLCRHFRTARSARSFNLVLFKTRDQALISACIDGFSLASHLETRSAGISPQTALSLASPSQPSLATIPLITDLGQISDSLVQRGTAHLQRGNVMPLRVGSCLQLTRNTSDRSGYFFLGARLQQRFKCSDGADVAWAVNPADRIRGFVQARPHSEQGCANVQVRCYESNGSLLSIAKVGTISRTQGTVSFQVTMPKGTSHCNLLVSLPSTCGPIQLEDVVVERDEKRSFVRRIERYCNDLIDRFRWRQVPHLLCPKSIRPPAR